MQQSYQVITNRTDVNHIVNQLHREESLAVGIMDTGTVEDLKKTINWYRKYFNYCLHIITRTDRFTPDEIRCNYPDTTFILFNDPPTLAQRINSLADTCMTTYFLLVRSDTELVDINWKGLISEMQKKEGTVCLTPLVFNKDKELVPTVRAPKMQGNRIDPQSFMPSHGNDDNLYPFLGIGFYARALYQRLRGFDSLIDKSYWQALDFGTRCWLYGYPIVATNSLAFIFPEKQFLIEDRSETESVVRFYTKVLGVKLVRGRIRIKKVYKTDMRVLKTEVKPKLAFYKTDFDSLLSNWEVPKKEN